MKTKHTFGFTFVLGLVWTGILFAYSAGPDPGVNGIVPGVTCNQSGCHNSFALNSGTGSVNIVGLPATWTPGQTYSLSVTVAGGARYGFQFSAVNNSTNTQAGTLLPASPGDARVQFITGGGIQYAEHNSFANTSGTFNIRWTAPASAGLGDVRFNVAGNATNNDGTSLGDRIYTRAVIVSPGAIDTTAPVISAVTKSNITTSGATIAWTTDEASDTQVEFGTTAAYGQSTALDATPSMAHSADLTGLASNTTYHYRVNSRDAAGNLATSGDNTLITAFTISNLGGVSRTTDGSGQLAVGYGRILANSGTTPSGVGIFGLEQSGLLVTEAGVPDQPLITSGRIYAEVTADGIVSTGLAFANPSPTTAAITYTIRDTSGNVIKSDTTTVDPNGERVGFLHEAPYSLNSIQGTFTFTSTIPVAAIALRSFYNERTPSEFMLTTLPVIDLAAAASSGTQVIPHFAAGEGWTTQVILVNPTGVPQTGTIQFLDPGAVTPPTPGAPKTVTIDGTPANSQAYSVAANSSKKFIVTGGATLAFGSVRIVPAGAGPAPTPLVIFTLKVGGFTQSEAGIPVTMGTAFRMYAQLSSSARILTGLAIANPTAVAGTVTLTLTDLDGVQIATTNPPLDLPASGQIVRFIDQMPFIPSVAGQTLQGVLQITTNLSSISVAGLRGRYNKRDDFLITTTPPTLENSAPSTAERLFPHLANGGGYTTQFILFSGTSGQVSGGTLSFVKPDGTPLDLNIN